jgi:hypothetical protein
MRNLVVAGLALVPAVLIARRPRAARLERRDAFAGASGTRLRACSGIVQRQWAFTHRLQPFTS